MCGIFGFIATGSKHFDVRRLETIAKATEARGRHAFGFAWLDPRGRLRMFKRPGAIGDYLGALSMARDARMLIGHCRFATHGRPENNLNNHPHACDGGWLVHNGVVHDHKSINEGYMLSPVTNCDSETLSLLIEELDGGLFDRVTRAAKECASDAPLAMAGLWKIPQRLVIARINDQPLHLGSNGDGVYFASLPTGIPNARILPDNSAISFQVIDGDIKATRKQFDAVDVTA